jgi:hypothetical protein
MNPGDLYPADAWRETEHKAARRYNCVACGGVIPVGLRYVLVVSLADGEWSRLRVHACCRDFLRTVQLRNGPTWGILTIEDVTCWAEEDGRIHDDRRALDRELAEIALLDVTP